MEKIHRLGRMQKQLLIIATTIVFLVVILISLMMQILNKNQNLIDSFIEQDLKNLAQVTAIDNAASQISALAITLNQMGDFSRFREKIVELNAEINYLKVINSQIHQDKIDEAFINNLLSSSQKILQQGNKIIGYTADIQAVLFELDNMISTYQQDENFTLAQSLHHQFLSLSGQDNNIALNFIKQQIHDFSSYNSLLSQKIHPLFEELTTLYEERAKLHKNLVFLSFYLGVQSNETNKIATMLLDEISKKNQEKAQNIAYNAQQKRHGLILASLAIIVTILCLLYIIAGDFGKNMHQISTALLKLAQGQKTNILLPVKRKDEIGDLSRAYQFFEQHLMNLAQVSEKLSKQNQMMQTVFNTMRDGLSVFDTKAQLVSWNNKYSELIDVDAQNLKIGLSLESIEDILQKKHVKNISTRGQNIDFKEVTSKRLYKNVSFEKHYPKGRILEIRSSPMEAGGFVTLYLDRTARRSLEQKYQQAQKLEAIGTMTNGIAHDFNNFLAVICGNIELLWEESQAEKNTEQTEKLQQIKRICNLAQEQIERLLVFSRKEEAIATLFDANQLVKDVFHVMKPLLKDENIKLSCQLCEPPLFIKANISELESAILNLISNSQKAIKEQGEIILKTSLKNGYVEISVRDDGVGMDEETSKHIFEPFYSQQVNDIQGTGLGLSMTYGAINRAQGDIVVETQKGCGCLITLRLPQNTHKHDHMALSQEKALTRENVAQKISHVILVVDDNKDIRKLLARQLQQLGHMTLEAEDGEIAQKYLEQSKDIDFVFSDIMMDKMSGIALAQYMHIHHKDIPLVLLSAHNAHNLTEYQALEPKPAFIRKPWKMEDIEELLQNH